MNYQGFADSFHLRQQNLRLSGWAVSLGSSGDPISVDLVHENRTIASTIANLPRPDVVAAGVSPGPCGFEFNIDGSYFQTFDRLSFRVGPDGATLPVVVRLIPDTDPTVLREPLLGGVTSVCLDNDILQVDGFYEHHPETHGDVRLLAYLTADEVFSFTGHDVTDSATKNGRTARLLEFCIRAPRPEGFILDQLRIACPALDTDFRITSETRVLASSHDLWPPVAITEGDTVAGFLHSQGILRGWVSSLPLHTARPQQITVEVDDVPVWSGLAQRRETIAYRDDRQTLDLGFKVELPLPSVAKHTRRIAILDHAGNHLPGSPREVTFGDQYIGKVELLEQQGECLEISGWCVDSLHPSEKVTLIARLEGEAIGIAVADQKRADLGTIGFDTPFGGFRLRVPHSTSRRPDEVAVFPSLSFNRLPADEAVVQSALGESDDSALASFGMPTDDIEGTIDRAEDGLIRGWARNKTHPEATVFLDLFINGLLFSTTAARRFRADLKKHFNDHGCHEYLFEVPETVGLDFPGDFQIVPRVGRNLLNAKLKELPRAVSRAKTILPTDGDYLARFRHGNKTGKTKDASFSLIVVNRNGELLLQSLFSSFKRRNHYRNYEFIIVDHNSTDASESVCKKWAKSINIRWLGRQGNFSFSASNNYAARICSSDIVVFINNDITFHRDILGDVNHALSDKSVGCVGIRLMDDCPVERSDRQTGIQHLGVHFNGASKGFPIAPYESRFAKAWDIASHEATMVPAVTGAFLACRKDEFLQIGGFNEDYFYGYEDVDLCLLFRKMGRNVVCLNDISALHLRAYSRDKMGQRFNNARTRNRDLINGRFGFWLRRRSAVDRFQLPGFWSGRAPRIAFVVTEATETTLAGDYFTALEVAGQLSSIFPCECSFLEVEARNQFDLAGFDVVIAMRDDYDPSQIKNAPAHLIKVAWIRNWFDRFADRPGAALFDRIWASSPEASDYIAEQLGKPVTLIPIAANSYRFQAGKSDSTLESDYCFTGSYWGINREIIQRLDPAALPFRCAIYGAGWDKVAHLAPFARGSLPYKRMPDVYASTRLVIDDANHVTKSWGAVNSRVFDALVAGALVVTNGAKGSRDLFDGLLPVYETAQDLEDLLWKYLGNEQLRRNKVKELQALVLTRHTYQIRARTIWADLDRTSRQQLRISIKIGAPTERVQHEWGDYHFAKSMKRAFEAKHHTVRIDCIDQWEKPVSAGDDLVIALRGLTAYKPKPHQINFLWSISHPDSASRAEIDSFDHVFVASRSHAAILRQDLGEKVSVLLQCTDARLFHPEVPLMDPAPKVLFIGNSRNEFRKIVRDAVAVELPLEVYGNRWDGFLPESYIKGEYVANDRVASFYRSADLVLNDHWDTMRLNGFISNRLFDAAACGARVVSDHVDGIEKLFGPCVATYRDAQDLRKTFAAIAHEDDRMSEARADLAATVVKEHTFTNRIDDMLLVYDRLEKTRMNEECCF